MHYAITAGTLTCGAQSKASAPEIKKRGYVSKYNWRKKSFKKQYVASVARPLVSLH